MRRRNGGLQLRSQTRKEWRRGRVLGGLLRMEEGAKEGKRDDRGRGSGCREGEDDLCGRKQ